MKYTGLLLIVVLLGCVKIDSPEFLKRRDEEESKCTESCKPRKMKAAFYNDLFDEFRCACEDKKLDDAIGEKAK